MPFFSLLWNSTRPHQSLRLVSVLMHLQVQSYVCVRNQTKTALIFLQICIKHTFISTLKPLYTFGKQYCPSPTHRVSQLIYKITILLGENNGKTHSCFRAFRRIMTCVYKKSIILVNENLYCFTVFTKSKAFHGLIFQEKSFTITFCKPCKLFVNL